MGFLMLFLRPGCRLPLAAALACWLATGAHGQPEPDEATSLTVLTNAHQVLSLGIEEAARRHHPVTLDAVVTLPMAGLRWVYVQDQTAGLLVIHTNALLQLESGDRVRIRGHAFAGQYAVHVTEADVEVLGHGPLPQPKRADPARLADGADFGEWVELDGRVVDAFTVKDTMVLRAAAGSRRFLIRGNARDLGALPAGKTPPEAWLDAKIRVRGVCWTEVDDWNRPIGFRLHSPGSNCVTVLAPGNRNLFARPLTPIKSLRPGNPPDAPRVKVAGTLTHMLLDEWIFLQDETGPVRARILPPLGRSQVDMVFRDRSHQEPLVPGDHVEVVGHVAISGPAPALTDADYRRVGRNRPVKPTAASAAALASGALDSRLVTVRARLVDRQTRVWAAKVEEILVLQSGDLRFPATLRTDRTNTLAAFPTGATLQVAGVCLMGAGELGASTAPNLLLRSAADIALVRNPWPWESLPPGRILAVTGGLGAVAAVWISLLRRQIRQRIRAEEKARRSELATRTVNDFATSLLQHDTEAEVLWDLAKNCVAKLGFADCVIYLLDPARAALVQTAAHGPKNLAGQQIRNPIVLPLGQGIVGSVAASGLAEIVPDTRKDPRYVRDGGRYLSEIAVPISAHGRVIGVIDSEHPDAGFFTPEHLEILTAIASLCANKLVRVRAEEQLRALNAGLERRVADRTVELASANAQLKQAEVELLKALAQEKELSELKSRFVSMVSHEFRTPLGVIMSSSEILRDYLDRLTPERRAEHLQDIFHCTRHMASLMEEVLLLSRAEAGKLEFRPAPLDLAAFCQRLVREVTAATDERCPIELRVPTPLPEARADEGLLRHILTNLLTNAVKYSPNGSPVELRIEPRNQTACFTVSDRGIGILEADARQLFQAFHRGGNVGQTPGNGLGLVIVKRCVELHQGRIAFGSQPSQGATFVILLPVFGAAPAGGNTTFLLREHPCPHPLTLIA